MMLYRDVGLVYVMFPSAFSDEEHAVEEEECTLVLSPMDTEVAFQYQFSVSGQIRTLPVNKERLNFLNRS